MKYIFTLLITFFFFTQVKAQFCTNDNRFSEIEIFNNSQLTIEQNIEYGEAVNYEGNNQKLLLDAVYPSSSADDIQARPMVMLIHGGAFQFGSKEDWIEECKEFAKRGFVAFSINYRLGWDTNLESIEAIYRANQDASAALRYITSQHSHFGIDTNWIFVGGGSAGAITAITLNYADESEWKSILFTLKSKLGPLHESGNNLAKDFTIKGIFNNWGATHPIFIEEKEIIPMISFHGELDPTVSIDTGNGGLIGSRPLHKILSDNAKCSEFNIDPTGDHGIYVDPSGTIYRIQRASCFFKSIMCNSCNTNMFDQKVAPDCSTYLSTSETHELKTLIYPNPIKESINIKGLIGNEQFILYSSKGEIIKAGKDFHLFGIEQLQSGFYFLKIISENKQELHKLIKY